MAEVTISNSPVHRDSILTAVYGDTSPTHWQTCGFHTGTDFARYGYTEQPLLYSVCSGTVVLKRYETVLGNVVLIRDSTTGYYWRYCHLNSESPLSVGQSVDTSTVVGQMGQTGTGADGIHLHLECSTSEGWICANFLNPSTQLGIPNERNTIVHYGTPPPPVLQWIYANRSLNQVEMENNAQIVINYYRSIGLHDNTIAAILGNMQAESTIEPIRTESGGSGYGLVQWTPRSVLENHVSALGLSDYTNGDVQLQVIIAEILGNPSSVLEWYTTQAFINNYISSGATEDMIGISGSDFLYNTMGWNEQKLAIMFMVGYERPAYSPETNHVEFRKQCATNWLIFMGGTPPPPPPPPVDYGEKKFPFVLYSEKLRNRRK